MTEKKRIRVVSNGRAMAPGDTQVFIDGEDVSRSVMRVSWSIGAGFPENMAVATVTFLGAELDVEYVAEQRERCRTPCPGCDGRGSNCGQCAKDWAEAEQEEA